MSSIHDLSYVPDVQKAPSDEFGEITQYVFGKWIGQLLNIIYILYFASLTLTVLYHYMDVIHVWLFKEISGLLFASVLLLLLYYIHTGGFRTIAGWAFFSIVLTYWMTFICFYVMKYSRTFASCSPCLIIPFTAA
ncbi:GerAB/ArcD/ProY family transporter [Bacillus sp. SL00103]